MSSDNQKKINSLLKEKKLIIFDFDGVIADSVEVKTQAFSELYSQHGNNVVKKVIAHHRKNGGMSRFEKFIYYHRFFLGRELSSFKLNNLSNKFSKIVVQSVIEANEIPGALNFLKKCNEEKKICIVNSATPLKEIKHIVKKRGLDKYFSAIYGSPKDKTKNLKNALKKFGLSPNDAVFFGDALSDYNAARNMVIDFVGVGSNIKSMINKNFKTIFINNFINLI